MAINSKIILKNTLFLFLRMILTMLVALFTTRIVFNALGVEDYGIYNIVSGTVVILCFINGTISTASSRYITVAIGKNDKEETQTVFSNIFFLNVLIAVIVFILAETVGLWFIYNKLQIPSERFNAAVFVYHISTITVILNILSIPYNAAIIAHERMKAFAYITIFDAFAKLILTVVLLYVSFDKLIMYSILLLIVQLIDRIIYIRYCVKNFEETHIKFSLNKKLFKDMFTFILWGSYGSFVSVGFIQGLNILLNIFFGPTINAARGIAVQIQSSIISFTNNFQTALAPQLTKSTSNGLFLEVQKMLIHCSKLSFYMLCILGLPVIAEAGFIINIWLGNEPEYSALFCRIILITSLWGSLAYPLRIINQAEGNIKKNQIYECTLLLFIVPLSYILLKIWALPALVFIVHLIIELIAQYIRIKIVLPKIGMQIKSYVKDIYVHIFPVFVIPLLFVIIVNSTLDEGLYRFIINLVLIEALLIILILSIGTTSEEKLYIKKNVRKIFLHSKE